MRPCLVPMVVVLIAVAAFGQQPGPRPYGPCFYECGPFVPMVTTPEISLQQFSPSPVGATNATAGLIAGATNSTLSEVQGSTSSVYTVAVWYQGGAPFITPQVKLWPEPIGREGHPMHDMMHEGHAREERPREEHAREDHGREDHAEKDRLREEHAPLVQAQRDWTYFTGGERTASSRKATHSYTNTDVSRQNDKNGTVKHDGKTEKM